MKTIDELIEFYENIPEDQWCSGIIESVGRCCALGHLFNSDHYDSSILVKFSSRGFSLPEVNDACRITFYKDQLNIQLVYGKPKENILKFLRAYKQQTEKEK